jgi:hypothetical protein
VEQFGHASPGAANVRRGDMAKPKSKSKSKPNPITVARLKRAIDIVFGEIDR